MSFNTRWLRWISASIDDWFNTNKDASLVLFREGQERNTQAVPNFIELRVDGPNIDYQSSDWTLAYEINVLIQVSPDKDLNKIKDVQGLVIPLFARSIPVFKYGPDPVLDDESQIACLQLKGDIVCHDYGQIEPRVKRLQATVEAQYQIVLED
jgi:hypothetical protein